MVMILVQSPFTARNLIASKMREQMAETIAFGNTHIEYFTKSERPVYHGGDKKGFRERLAAILSTPFQAAVMYDDQLFKSTAGSRVPGAPLGLGKHIPGYIGYNGGNGNGNGGGQHQHQQQQQQQQHDSDDNGGLEPCAVCGGESTVTHYDTDYCDNHVPDGDEGEDDMEEDEDNADDDDDDDDSDFYQGEREDHGTPPPPYSRNENDENCEGRRRPAGDDTIDDRDRQRQRRVEAVAAEQDGLAFEMERLRLRLAGARARVNTLGTTYQGRGAPRRTDLRFPDGSLDY